MPIFLIYIDSVFFHIACAFLNIRVILACLFESVQTNFFIFVDISLVYNFIFIDNIMVSLVYIF